MTEPAGNGHPAFGGIWCRREFLQRLSLGAGVLAAQPWQAMAGPFAREDFERLVPADKKLRPEWVKSLTTRGERAVYRGKDLEKIGIPIGGICAGQVYLGGDGKLWRWDIFNQRISTGAEHYAKPLVPSAPFEQGFGIRVHGENNAEFRPLDAEHWEAVSFTGEYPIGYVEYCDAKMPVRVTLQAFSPFIPLNTADSALPATVLQFTVHNESARWVALDLTGWLENPVCLYSSHQRAGLRHNRLSRTKGLLLLECSASETLEPSQASGPLESEPDFGTLALAVLDPRRGDYGSTSAFQPGTGTPNTTPTSKAFGEKLLGTITKQLRLAPGASSTVTFVLSWHMPNLRLNRLPPGRHYAARFGSAAEVAGCVAKNFERLASETKLWHDTWYDSTLPFWFLDRTFLNSSILASSTCYRLADGRFYAWEGVGCCEGTCGHVWQYAHALARLFPDLERMTREKVDFGFALQPDGAIHFRGEFNDFPAIDAQSGSILRALREHQMCSDDAFLRRTWPMIKRATEWLIHKDGDNDGLIGSNQHNTLDTDWFGEVAWLSGLYLAALMAAAELGDEAGDNGFAARCREIVTTGRKNLTAKLFDGEYFINKPDPRHLDAINSGTGCEIDQVFGQSWAFQVGLPRVLPQTETCSALRALWRYNFTPDVGPYRARYKPGRWYAMPGEAGLLMCTFPRSDWDYNQAKGKGPDWAAGYFNECMNGFEYQVAGHMLWEGLITEGLAVTRAVHDRYHPSRRNPWNEVECGDHYARSMASYGVFLAACGFEYHGPMGHLGFSPRVTLPSGANGQFEFKAAFTAAEGWGSFSQVSNSRITIAKVLLKWGKLRVRSLALTLAPDSVIGNVQVRVNGRPVASQFSQTKQRLRIGLSDEAQLHAHQSLEVSIS